LQIFTKFENTRPITVHRTMAFSMLYVHFVLMKMPGLETANTILLMTQYIKILL